MRIRLLAAVGVAFGLGFPIGVAASNVDSAARHVYSQNMHPLGDSPRENTASPFTADSDLAFWGDLAYHVNYDGSGSSTSALPPTRGS
jgi:hypothetical protein